MTEDMHLAELFDEEQQPTSAPTESTAPDEPVKTDLDVLKAYFKQFPTVKAARAAVNDFMEREKAKGNTYSKGNCYKAVRKLEEEGAFKGEKPRMKKQEPVTKIPEPDEMEITVEDETAPAEPEQPFIHHEDLGQGLPPMPLQPQPFNNTKAELEPIQERGFKNIINNVFEIVDVKGNGGEKLVTDQEAKDTVTLLPYIIRRLSKKELSEESYIDLTIGAHVCGIASKALLARLKQRKTQPSKPEPPAEPTPTPEPTPTQPTEPSQPAEKRGTFANRMQV